VAILFMAVILEKETEERCTVDERCVEEIK
jgi:hypothetical protein